MSLTTRTREQRDRGAGERTNSRRPGPGTWLARPGFLAARAEVSQPGDAGERRRTERIARSGDVAGRTRLHAGVTVRAKLRFRHSTRRRRCRTGVGLASGARFRPAASTRPRAISSSRDSVATSARCGSMTARARRDGAIAGGAWFLVLTSSSPPGRHRRVRLRAPAARARALAHVVSGGAKTPSPRAGCRRRPDTAAAAWAGRRQCPCRRACRPRRHHLRRPVRLLRRPREGVRRDAFALRHMHLERYIPSTTFGMFDGLLSAHRPDADHREDEVQLRLCRQCARHVMEWMRAHHGGGSAAFFLERHRKGPISRAPSSAAWPARWSAQHHGLGPVRYPISVPFRWSCRSRWDDDASARYVTTIFSRAPGGNRLQIGDQ